MQNLKVEGICRTCMSSKNENLLSIFDIQISDTQTVQMVDFIIQLTSIEISKDDGFPQQLCMVCVDMICQIYNFIQTCKENDSTFRIHYSNTKTSIEPNACLDEEKKEIKTEVHQFEEDKSSVRQYDSSYSDSCTQAETDINKVKEESSEQKYTKYGETFNTTLQLKKHKLLHELVTSYECKQCFKAFSKENHLKVHMRLHVQDKKYVCEICDQKFIYSYLLNQHSFKHKDEKPFPCSKCERGCLTAESLRRHMKIHDENYQKKTHACPICNKEFQYPSFVTEHMKNHTGEKPFLCSTCGKGFRQRGALDYHIRSHTGYRPHQCHICKSTFSSKGVLRVHLRRHTDERPYICDICGVGFRQSTDMNRHRSTHSGDKHALCTVCGKQISTTGQLKIHLRTHTGEKPFTCDICQKAFTTRTMLVKHRRIHTGERPYSCSFCGRSFSQSSTLKTHIMVHSKDSNNLKNKNNQPLSNDSVNKSKDIAKFYSFKKILERNDKFLRNYLKQMKFKETKEFSDILHKAVNDAEIEVSEKNLKAEKTNNLIIIPRNNCNKKEIEIRTSQRLLRKSKLRANEMINTIIKEESYNLRYEVSKSQSITEEAEKDESISPKSNNVNSIVFNDGPPPLIPLAFTKSESSIDKISPTVKNLPENAPPLVPIKPLSSLNPAVIVNALSDHIEAPVKLKLQCNICNEEFYSVAALKNHRLYQCQMSGMQCNICKKEFNNRNRLIGHLKGHMILKQYGCKICGKRYPNPSTFRVHMRTHTGERPFKCQVCNKGFVRWAGVVGHMKTHNANKPFKCNTCGKGFKISSNLERHKILHSGILPYCCSYCGKTFSQSDNLQLHVRTYHTNDRPYLCNECGKRFVSWTRLKRHMWVHTGYKPYRCRFCSKAYSNSNDCKNHEKGHTGGISENDKPHACITCGMRFLHACRLAKHMKTHERPFPCSDCTKTFSSENLLSKHISNKHGTQLIDHLSVPLSVNEVYINYQ
ncbi:hypothetical protein FQA39_LY12053 [Lamprigera yunnana]|nr:hypothetical protein FQA39_LY12053 [Lamprigera yunnana]